MHPGNTTIRASRQSGKSFAESIRISLFALLNAKTTTLIIASVDRQSIELLEKVTNIVAQLAKSQIKGRPTQHRLELRNGSKIMAEPAGQTGYGLRGFTVHKLVADEAHYIAEAVFVAIRPMLATTGGTMDLLSTPRGNHGFFYDSFSDDTFWKCHVRWEQCNRYAQGFIEQEKKRLTKLDFAQEYEAEFVDALQQFFPEELIHSCIQNNWNKIGRNYLGVDFAGHGEDPNAFAIIQDNGSTGYVIYNNTKHNQKAWQTVNQIKQLDLQYNFKKIGVDDGGLGAPILDYMLIDSQLKRKALGLNNAKRDIDSKGHTKQLQGNDMYANLRIMMEQGKIKYPENDELIRSIRSIQYEIDKETKNIKIHGKHDHICEALKRAAWLIKAKGLNIMSFC